MHYKTKIYVVTEIQQHETFGNCSYFYSALVTLEVRTAGYESVILVLYRSSKIHTLM